MFPLDKLKIKHISERKSDLKVSDLKTLNSEIPYYHNDNLDKIIEAIKDAREKNKPVIVAMGAHVLRQGNGCYIKDLILQNYITHIATNMAFAIHDYELAFYGETTENVEHYLKDGQFGLWESMLQLNRDIKFFSNKDNDGLGRTIGRIYRMQSKLSIFNNAYGSKCSATIHVNLGFDILAELPNYNPELIGRLSYNDFLLFAETLLDLGNGGVFLNIGSAIMGTEVFIKALAMARNIKHQQNEKIENFTIGVFDIIPLENKSPDKTDWQYYCRFNKTLLHRITDKAYYVNGNLDTTFPNLWKGLIMK